MSATQDKSHKVAFVYSNLYKIYRKGKEAAEQSSVPSPEASAQVPAFAVPGRQNVLKSEDLRHATLSASVATAAAPAPRIEEYKPAEFIGKRVARPAVIPSRGQRNEAVESLKQNLKSLNDLHSRLRFMLLELEDLVKE